MSYFYGKFKAVIFDLDGVIVDSEPIHKEVMNSICSQWGNPHTQEEYENYIGKTDLAIWTAIKNRYQVDLDIDKIIKHYNSELTRYYQESKNLPITDGISELLEALKKEGIACAVGSASSRTNIEITLAHVQNRDVISTIVSGDDVIQGKPSPEIFLTAAKKMNVHPSDCTVIEDTGVGVLAANNAEMFCIAYANPTSGKQNLTTANKIIYSIKELL